MLTTLSNYFNFSQSETITTSPHSDTNFLADTLQISMIYENITQRPPGQKKSASSFLTTKINKI